MEDTNITTENDETLESNATATSLDETAVDKTAIDETTRDETAVDETALEEASQPFVGRWNHLVSTTNWEKGRIIFEWRAEMATSDVPASEYSDEAWAQRVGGVTGQHVGRLRRVYQRFGQVYTDYDGLYWSHFQACSEWEDAEMWLEGAIQNNWSVSQMRRQRWETLGQIDKVPQDSDIVTSELDEDFEPALNDGPAETISGTLGEVQDASGSATATAESKKQSARAGDAEGESSDGAGASIYSGDSPDETIPFVRPFENLAELPEDLMEAFESFKLAILRHKAEGWDLISRDEVLASLEALKELAMAPATDDAPF